MAKLTKKDREALRAVLRNAERARDFLHSDRIAVARVEKTPTTTLHYHRGKDSRCLYEIEKSYGSDLVGLDTAIGLLADYLVKH